MRASLALLCVLACACTGQMISPDPDLGPGADGGVVGDANVPDSSAPPGSDGGLNGGVDASRMVVPGTGVNRTPVLSNFRVESGDVNRVMFDSSEPIRGVSANGILVSGRTVTSVRIVDGATVGHSFEVAEAFDYYDNNTIRYEGEGDIEDLEGNGVHPFSLQYVDNLIPEPESTEERFATATATGGGDGRSEATAWTLWEAASEAVAGQTVWVKAGRYTGREMYVAQSGTAERPIKFVGYKETPGDITSMYYAYPAAPDLGEMPTLDNGLPEYGRNTHIRGDFLVFRNFQSININGQAFYATNAPEGVIFDNCVAHNATTPSGVGFFFNSQAGRRNRVINSITVNTSMVGVYFAGSFQLVDNVKVYSDGWDDGETQANDYYIGLNSQHSIVRNSYAERRVDDSHGGHGIALKSEGTIREVEYNLIENCTVVGSNPGMELRHEEVRHNVVRNCTFLRGEIPADSVKPASGIVIRDGAHHNRIESCHFRGVRRGISFRDNSEEGAQPGGEYNLIINSTFEDLQVNISAYRANGLDGRVSHNTFINNTFVGSQAMYYDPRRLMADGTNRVINSIIFGVPERYENADSGFEESHNNYWLSYAAPDGEGNMSVDPQFVNVDARDFRLQASSPLVDAGEVMAEVMYDQQGVERPQGDSHDLGAFEYFEDGAGQ